MPGKKAVTKWGEEMNLNESGNAARIVLEQNKLSKKKLPLIIEPVTLGLW